MRIFLTGATGYVGSAVLDALVRGGHEVTALVRTNENATRVASRGAKTVLGDLSEPASYRDAADGFDAYVLTAYDMSGQGPDVDRRTIDTFLRAAAKRAKDGPCALVYTSRVWVLGPTAKPAAEDAPTNPTPLVAWRPAHEQMVLEAGGDGLRTMVVRPGIVYGGVRGIVSDLLKDAGNGLIRVIGDGENHWPLIYDRDMAELYARLVARPNASGIYHANDEGDERVNDIVEGIVQHLTMRPDVRHMPLEEARSKLGPYADALALDQCVRSTRARALGWAPSLHSVSGNVPRLLEEFRAGQKVAQG